MGWNDEDEEEGDGGDDDTPRKKIWGVIWTINDQYSEIYHVIWCKHWHEHF